MPLHRLPRASLVVAAALAGAGCIHTEFVQSSPSFVVHEAAQRPTVYFDHLPERPYASVGVIEVVAPSASSMQDVFAAASDKGREIGCDVVVDRSIHRVSDAALPRFRITALEPAAPAPATTPTDARALGYAPTPAPQVIVAPAPPPVTYTTTPVYAPPPDRREFICGVWATQ